MSTKSTIAALPVSFVTKDEINLRVTNFMNTKHNVLTAELGKEDTKSIWYALPHLEQILDELRYKGASGLRIYFGAYATTHENFGGQLCLLMVPTRADAQTMGHNDVIAEEEADFPERLAQYDPSEIEELYKTFNFGSPCPPACGAGDTIFPY